MTSAEAFDALAASCIVVTYLSKLHILEMIAASMKENPRLTWQRHMHLPQF